MSSNIENARVSEQLDNEQLDNEQLDNEQLDNEQLDNEHVSDNMSEHVSDSMDDSMNSSDNEIINELNNWEPLTDFENVYEIETKAPHRIRRIYDGFMPKISMCKATGYYQVCLNKRTYPYHRILATHFVPNPNGMPEVDHEDRNKTNNELSNLRWVDRSGNLRNRSTYVKQKTEFLDHAPDDIIRITEFNGVEYQPCKYYFCFKNNRVIQRVNISKWQWLARTPHQNTVRVIMRDINGQNHQVNLHKLIKRFTWRRGNKPPLTKRYTVGELKALTNPETLTLGQYRIWKKLHIEMAKKFSKLTGSR